jgi:flagellar motor switch protein FliG
MPDSALPEMADISYLTGAERAAIFVMYLEEDVVRELFERLGEDEIRAIGGAISRLERVEPDTVQAVISNFAGDLSRTLYLQHQGDEYLHHVFPSVLGPERARRMLRSIEPVTRNDFRKTFGRLEPGALAARLAKEHPQTIAVACAVLGPEMTGGVLGHFEPELQASCIARLAKLRKIPMELLEDIEELLGRCDGATEPSTTMEADGPSLAADALSSLRDDMKDEVLSILAEIDEELAGEISRRMFSFDLLRSADARGIQRILKGVERRDLALALKGASAAVSEKFFSNMSTRAAGFLKDDMDAMGPVRLADVEAAQEEIMSVALTLEDDGDLMFMEGGDVVE